MTPTKLAVLRKSHNAFNRRWRDRGGRLTAYRCGHCRERVQVRRPKPSDLGPGRACWDSMCTCVHCGGLNFVAVYPSGKTEVTTIGGPSQ